MKNEYRIEGNKVYIYLLNIDEWTIIDLMDLERTDEYAGRWYGFKAKNTKSYYVNGDIKNEDGIWVGIKMHRWILKLTDPKIHPDHKDGDTLNNMRDNLNIVTPSENAQNRKKFSNNTSGYTGISWHKKSKKWSARIMINNRSIHLGYFNDPKEASIIREKAKEKYHPYGHGCRGEKQNAI
jgi:hypothetical protein